MYTPLVESRVSTRPSSGGESRIYSTNIWSKVACLLDPRVVTFRGRIPAAEWNPREKEETSKEKKERREEIMRGKIGKKKGRERREEMLRGKIGKKKGRRGGKKLERKEMKK